jgi:FKBP-type peptidyl-prolyl cis-trans isomerase SlyD
MQAAVASGKVVSIHYTLADDEGSVLDSSAGREPLAYLHGAGNIVPGLERELTGKRVGDALKVRVPPEEGYGLHDPRGVRRAPRSAFPPDAHIEAGMEFSVEVEDGRVVPVWIAAVEPDAITVDFNHPLAGVALNFDVTVTAIRDATAEEIAHGHPHGPGGRIHIEE